MRKGHKVRTENRYKTAFDLTCRNASVYKNTVNRNIGQEGRRRGVEYSDQRGEVENIEGNDNKRKGA